MLEFRYYCLDAEGKIARGRHLLAPDLATAIQAAYEDCGSHPTNRSTRVEVWQRGRCLYTSPERARE